MVTQNSTVSVRGGVVAALFHESGQGERALADLKSAGFSRVEISQADAGDDTRNSAPARDDRTLERAPGPAQPQSNNEGNSSPFFHEHDSSASSFVDELVTVGFSRHDAHDLVDGLIKGGALVTADAGESVDRAVSVFSLYHGDVRYASGTPRPAIGSAAVAGNQLDTAPALVKGDDAAREIQLRAERLAVNKRLVQHGEARIRKEIVTELKTIDVPVSHEELVIERHAVSGDGTVDNEPIEEQTLRIPLTEETVTVSKQTIVHEEVEIGTRRVEDVAHVSDVVRHEELRVDEPSGTPPSSNTRPQAS